MRNAARIFFSPTQRLNPIRVCESDGGWGGGGGRQNLKNALKAGNDFMKGWTWKYMYGNKEIHFPVPVRGLTSQIPGFVLVNYLISKDCKVFANFPQGPTSFPGLFPFELGRREKTLASAGHVPILHPKILGVIN